MQQSDTQKLVSIQWKWAYEAEFTANQVLRKKQVWLPGVGGVPKFHKHNRTHCVTSSHGCLVCCIALVSDRQDLWLETSVCIAETVVTKKLSWAQLQAPEKSVVIVSNDRCSWTAAAGLQGVSLKMNERCCFFSLNLAWVNRCMTVVLMCMWGHARLIYSYLLHKNRWQKSQVSLSSHAGFPLSRTLLLCWRIIELFVHTDTDKHAHLSTLSYRNIWSRCNNMHSSLK